MAPGWPPPRPALTFFFRAPPGSGRATRAFGRRDIDGHGAGPLPSVFRELELDGRRALGTLVMAGEPGPVVHEDGRAVPRPGQVGFRRLGAERGVANEPEDQGGDEQGVDRREHQGAGTDRGSYHGKRFLASSIRALFSSQDRAPRRPSGG